MFWRQDISLSITSDYLRTDRNPQEDDQPKGKLTSTMFPIPYAHPEAGCYKSCNLPRHSLPVHDCHDLQATIVISKGALPLRMQRERGIYATRKAGTMKLTFRPSFKQQVLARPSFYRLHEIIATSVQHPNVILCGCDVHHVCEWPRRDVRAYRSEIPIQRERKLPIYLNYPLMV